MTRRFFRSAPGQVRFTPEASAFLDAMTDEEAHANALADPEHPPLPDDRSVPQTPTLARLARRVSGMSQPAFAEAFGFTLGRLRDLEQGRTQPDPATESYLRLIQLDAATVIEMLAKAPTRAA